MKRNLYIAKDYEGVILAILLAPTKDHAQSFCAGAEQYPNTIDEIDVEELGDHPATFVIARSDEVNVSDLDRMDTVHVLRKR